MDDAPADDPEDRGAVAFDVHQASRARSDRRWDRAETAGHCVLAHARDDCETLLERTEEATRSFVAATDFDAAVLLYVESVGPTSGYDAIEFGDVRIEDGVLGVAATAVDAAPPTAPRRDVETYPAAFLRVTADPRPRRATAAIVDGWGNRSVVHVGHDGPSHALRREE